MSSEGSKQWEGGKIAGFEISLGPVTNVAVASEAGDLTAWKGDLLVLGAFEEDFETGASGTQPGEWLRSLGPAISGAAADASKSLDFGGKIGSSHTLRLGGSAGFLTLVGLGKLASSSAAVDSPFLALGAAASAAAAAVKAASLAAAVSPRLAADALPAALGRAAQGLLYGTFDATRFKSTRKPCPLERATFVIPQQASCRQAVDAELRRAGCLHEGVTLARQLVEAPACVATPTHLAEAAAWVASLAPERFELRVLEEEDCLARDMGCYLGVTSGAGTPPKLIHLIYTGAARAGADQVELALVGKGVTFDSGGYNLKTGPGCMIESMKLDMGGAGAVLGVARALADLQPAGVKVHFVTAACENMVDAKAVRPGDVLVASNGKTVEVINTDAEGRLTLCDAMVYIQKEAPKLHCLLDVATLTGACMVALGTRVGGVYSNREEVREGFCRLAREAGERFWPLPLENAYADELKSQIADLKNVGSRLAGSINGALFLHEFLESKDLPWIHLDIAGPVMDHKTGGATGYPTAALLHWILNFEP